MVSWCQRRHIAEWGLVDQRLIGLGHVALVIDDGEVFEIHREGGQPLPDVAEGIGEELGVDDALIGASADDVPLKASDMFCVCTRSFNIVKRKV